MQLLYQWIEIRLFNPSISLSTFLQSILVFDKKTGNEMCSHIIKPINLSSYSKIRCPKASIDTYAYNNH